MKKGIVIGLILVVVFATAQLFRPAKITNRPMSSLKNVPPEVAAILQNSCYDCHSSQTNLSWFDRITPANFFVTNHILKGRNAFDLSGWNTLSVAQQTTLLYYGLNKILKHEMPLPSYTCLYSESKLSKAKIDILKKYALSLSVRKTTDSLSQQADAQFQKLQSHKRKVADAPNGIAYIGDYRSWKIISISDRFENGSIRMIFVNKIAEDAIRNRQTNPWPDGAILVKAKWKQIVHADGSTSTGPFWQVETMIKDRKKYVQTHGWGWARWLDEDLKPYGKNALFTTECTSCHHSTKDNDFVFAKPLDLMPLLLKNK